MGWQNGIFRRLYSWTADASAGYDILADRMDADTNDIVGGVNNTLTRDGQNAPLANLPMSGFKHLGAAQATNPTDYARFDQVVTTSGNQTIAGNLAVTGAQTVGGDLTVTGAQTVGGNLTVTGAQTVGGNLTVTGNITGSGLIEGGGLQSTGNSTIGGNLTVGTNLTVGNYLSVPSADVTGYLAVGSIQLNPAGNNNITGVNYLGVGQIGASVVGISGALTVGNGLTLTGHLGVTGDANISTNLGVGGNVNANGAISGGSLSIGAGGGNITGDLSVAGTATLGGLDVTGSAAVNSLQVTYLYFAVNQQVLSSTAPPAGARLLYLA